MAQSKNVGIFGILFGSPFAFLGLILILGGKLGSGSAFLLLGLATASSGAVASRNAASPADEPPAS